MMILGIAVSQWIAVVAINFFKRMPKVLAASSLVLAIGVISSFGVRRDSAALSAAALPQHSEGSCALIEPGMAADVVRTKLGQPSEVRDDGRTRGPGAVTWVYRDSRCAVHLLDERVELVE
jgi:hypothetical protein